METCYIAQEAQLSALWRPRGEEWGGGSGREVQETLRATATGLQCSSLVRLITVPVKEQIRDY